MLELQRHRIYCPYCGESIEVLVDCSLESQSYIEDCQVCCRPIEISVHIDEEGNADLSVRHENE